MTHCQHCGGGLVCSECGQPYQTKPEEILDVLRHAIGPLTGYVIADRVYMSKSRVYEILTEYVDLGIVSKVGERGGYRYVRQAAMLPEREMVA